MTDRERIEELEAQLAASKKVIDALVRRAERQLDALSQGPDQFAVIKALSNLESIIDQRTRELHESEARYRALYHHSPDMLFTVDEAGLITAVNQTSLEAFDCEEDALLGCSLASLFDDDAQQTVERWVARGFSGLRDQELSLDDGRIVSVNAGAVPGFSGEIQVVLRDVTARRRLEAELGHARRLAAIGHLAAGVAHEINNPLTVLQLRLELLEVLNLPAPVSAQLKVLSEHTLRIARIVRNLQSFAHPRSEHREMVRLSELVAAAREVASPAIAHVAIRSDIPPDLYIHADRGRAEQVLVNLLTNAGDAQVSAGWIGITARRSADRVRIVVEDAGPGVASELLDHIFTPFVSGKPRKPYDNGPSPSSGSGLGLAIAWSIVKEHGGTIVCTNRPQGGARFELTFPLGVPEEVSPRGAPDVLLPGRTLRVLVIDDEPALLDLVERFTSAAGHEVVRVTSAEAALDCLAKESRFDVILSDIRLPGMSGRDLLRLLRRDRPELARRTALMSGFFHRPGAGVPYLQKPFGRRELLALLEEVAAPGDVQEVPDGSASVEPRI